MTTVVAIAGAKGGVGKTTTSLSLGAALAARGQSVAVVELDLAMGNFFDYLDVEEAPSEATMHDVLAESATVDDAARRVAGGFTVYPTGPDLDGFANASLEPLPGVLEALRDSFDVVLLDTGAGLSNETIRPLQVADEVVLVATPRVAAIRDTNKTKTLVERVGSSVAGLVLTKAGTDNAPPNERIAEFLGTDLFGHVPQDEAVPDTQAEGRTVVTAAPDSAAAAVYRDVADALAARLDLTDGDENEEDDRDEAATTSQHESDAEPQAAVEEGETAPEEQASSSDSQDRAADSPDAPTASAAEDHPADAAADETSGAEQRQATPARPVGPQQTQSDSEPESEDDQQADESDADEGDEPTASTGLIGRMKRMLS
ncbi:P-loop NTPase [Haloarculaceae archaeon H-GB2-1]|nr:P-loop NTPase [Haloarculaceae archaeon H-GB1-1]MEA5406262.1 P-loop NTPase [Haloarculaceae archaeon H-GB2-1]